MVEKIPTTDEIVWRPDPELVASCNLKAFIDACGVADYDALLVRADGDPEWFWNTAIAELGIRFDRPYDQVLDLSEGAPWARWCVGGTTNLALNTLDKHRGTPVEDQVAIIGESESGAIKTWTFRELDRQSCRLAGALRQLGLGPGDAVAVYMPMIPEVAAAYFAIARIGAVVVPLFSGFAAEAIASRLNDAEAVAVITVDGTSRRGTLVAMKPVLDLAGGRVASLRHVIVLDNLGQPAGRVEGRAKYRVWDWAELCADQPDRVATEMVDADSPLLLIYTSGTTGKPKGSILSHCGVVVKIALDFTISLDFRSSDRLVWMSDFGWAVGPMILTATTFAGGSIVLAEGAPDYPDPGRLWRLVQDHRVSFLGVSPTAVRTVMRYGPEEVAKFDLSSLRISASTGEPWTEEAWLWLFEHVCKRRVPLLNWSGGTEIGGGIISGTVMHPLKPCAFAGSMPGMAADIVDDHGNSVGPGEVGELVMRAPSIGLTRGLWRDRSRYLEAYWETFPGLWRHGDWASRDGDGMWYVLGRSDDTIKVAGKRTGPAEIEGLVMATGKISEAAAIGVPDPISGQAVMVVCVPAPGVATDEDLAAEVADAVTFGLGKPFRPKRLLFVADLPKTRSMKIMRRVVRATVLGEPPGDLSSLVNPEAVEELARARQAQADS